MTNQNVLSEAELRPARTCLVTGANGFVGSHLVDELLVQGCRVRALVRKTSNLQWLQTDRVELFYGDVTDADSVLPAADGCDIVYHVAGVIAARNREAYSAINAGGTRNVLEACLKCKSIPGKIVVVSSLAAGGPSGRGPAVTEDDPPNPISTYGWSKLEAERVVAEYADRLNICIVRPPVIYGPRDAEVFQFIKPATRWGIAPVGGRIDTPLSLAHVSDVVRGLIAAGTSANGCGRTYYISGPEDITWQTISDDLEAVLGRKIRRLCVPTPLARVIAVCAEGLSFVTRKPAFFNREKMREVLADGWVCCIDKARAEINFNPQVSVREGLADSIRWYREHKWL